MMVGDARFDPPLPLIGGPAPSDYFDSDWVQGPLGRLREDRLKTSTAAAKTDEIRFVWLRSFMPDVAIALRRTGERIELRCKMTGSGASSDALARNETRERPGAEWFALVALLNAGEFFREPERLLSDPGEDGSHWMIEVRGENTVQIVDRWSPRRGVVFLAGRTMIEMCGGEFGPVF